MYSNDTVSTPLNESSFSIPSTISSIEPLGSPAIKSQNLPLNGHFRSSSLHDVYVSRNNTPDISIGKRKYVPSHLSQFPYRKSYTPDRSSPLASQPSFTARPTTLNLRKSSSPPNWFGGPSFGIPKMGSGRGKAGHKIQEEDAPPTESLYDVGSSIRDLEPSSPSSENNSSSWFKDASSKLSSAPTSVILFGFPATLTSHVIAHFSRYGEILDHSATENPISTGSNWLKVTYADEEAANKAVSSNGTIIGGTYMVGCIFAPVEEVKTDKDMDVAMDLDAKTPSPHCITNQKHRLITPVLHQESPSANLGTPLSSSSKTKSCNGRRIEVLGSEGIFKETPDKTYSWITWSSTNKQTPEHPQTEYNSQWRNKLIRGIIELFFGF
ncbi:hypothetical protein PCANB_001802 [Pneumocystis canis]|nr:hypothetical protein PCANB_001802 [Pneumocystis canis]